MEITRVVRNANPSGDTFEGARLGILVIDAPVPHKNYIFTNDTKFPLEYLNGCLKTGFKTDRELSDYIATKEGR